SRDRSAAAGSRGSIPRPRWDRAWRARGAAPRRSAPPPPPPVRRSSIAAPAARDGRGDREGAEVRSPARQTARRRGRAARGGGGQAPLLPRPPCVDPPSLRLPQEMEGAIAKERKSALRHARRHVDEGGRPVAAKDRHGVLGEVAVTVVEGEHADVPLAGAPPV